jgi:hypothetical protein
MENVSKEVRAQPTKTCIPINFLLECLDSHEMCPMNVFMSGFREGSLYVDDLLIACNDIGILNEIKEGLSQAFEMKDMDQARMCLGFRIFRIRSERN